MDDSEDQKAAILSAFEWHVVCGDTARVRRVHFAAADPVDQALVHFETPNDYILCVDPDLPKPDVLVEAEEQVRSCTCGVTRSVLLFCNCFLLA